MYKETKFDEVLTNHSTRQPTTNPHHTKEQYNNHPTVLSIHLKSETQPSLQPTFMVSSALLITILSKNIKIILEGKAKCRRHEMTPEKIDYLGESDR
jgi:hypothetical protein